MLLVKKIVIASVALINEIERSSDFIILRTHPMTHADVADDAWRGSRPVIAKLQQQQ
jgi:hypothetical protein